MLKNQYRARLFLVPALSVFFGFFNNYYIIVFLILQNRFTNLYRNSDFTYKLLHVTGRTLGSYLQSYNLSWVIWFNLWFVIAKIVSVIFGNSTILATMTDLINFNIIMFVSFIVGNTISNSYLITISSLFLRSLGSSFVYSSIIGFVYLLLYLVSLTKMLYLNLLFFLITISIWRICISKQVRIIHIWHYCD